MTAPPDCRFCGTPLRHGFCDLGMSPVSNAFIEADGLRRMEPFYPLQTYVCGECLLVQLADWQRPEDIFNDDYAYFSSYSESWLRHAREYVAMMTRRFDVGPAWQVVEVASNDGYLLQYFRDRNVPVLGIEPAGNVAAAARAQGIPTWGDFFGLATARKMAAEGRQADLLIGNNVLAHVPDLNDFVAGVREALNPEGIFTFEFPHLLRLIESNQFDTIYHEHYSYLSLLAVERIFERHELMLFDVEELWTHGGSLRVFGRHAGNPRHPLTERVSVLREQEIAAGLQDSSTYPAFQDRVQQTKRSLLRFLIDAKDAGRRIAGYGAPAKGNTLLNYCGIGPDMLEYTVDRSPRKQGRFLPGTHLPIHPPERIFETRPDYLLILPWNLRDEIVAQMAGIRQWGGRFVTPIPQVEVIA